MRAPCEGYPGDCRGKAAGVNGELILQINMKSLILFQIMSINSIVTK